MNIVNKTPKSGRWPFKTIKAKRRIKTLNTLAKAEDHYIYIGNQKRGTPNQRVWRVYQNQEFWGFG